MRERNGETETGRTGDTEEETEKRRPGEPGKEECGFLLRFPDSPLPRFSLLVPRFSGSPVPFPWFSASPLPRFLLLILSLFSACASSPGPQVTIHRQHGGPIRVSVEIADTEAKRQFGLMYRQELPEMHGMLFIFPREQPLSFWMKNTPLPLDIIFINPAHTIVSIAQNTTPFSEKPLPSGKPAQFVLEVNGGFCQRHGIAAGDRVELPNDSMAQ